jgi:hypothetical protein
MERSAEWLRGAAHAAAECKQFKAAGWYQMLLAEAEAREASAPTAAEVIAAAHDALLEIDDYRGGAETVLEDEYVTERRISALAAIAKWKEAHNA